MPTFYATSFLGAPLTAGYKPAAFGAGWGLGYHGSAVTQGQVPFNVAEVPAMVRDPMVSFALRILRAPLAGVRWKINATSQDVRQFVHRQLRRFWKRDLVKACRMLEYGVAGGELTYKLKAGKIVYAGLKEIHPFDMRPLTLGGEFYGVRVQPMSSGGKTLDLPKPRAFWLANDAKFGLYYGRSRLEGAYEPWMEKRGKRGAADIRRMWFLKNAYRGARLRYPPGFTAWNGREVDNQEIARELVEKAETGFVIALPSGRDPMTKEFLWYWEDAASHGDVSGVREYYGDLNDEILTGAGIPVELVRAGETGSGYAGRAVPAQVFYRSEDEIVANIIDAVDKYMLRPLVLLNYGEEADYEIEPESLAEMMAQDQQAGQPGRAPVAPLPTGGGRDMRPPEPKGTPGVAASPPTVSSSYRNVTMQRDMNTRRFSRGDGTRKQKRRKPPRPLFVAERIRQTAAELADSFFSRPVRLAREDWKA